MLKQSNLKAIKNSCCIFQEKVNIIKYQLQNWIIVLLLSSVFWLSLISNVEAASQLPESHQRHILSRLGFGITTAQLEEVNRLGIESYIQSQLDPQSVTESPKVDRYLSKLDLIGREPIQLQKKVFTHRKKLKNSNLPLEQQKKLRSRIRNIHRQARDDAMDAHLIQAIYSNRQLQEVMVDFWFNHFNVFANKGYVRLWLNDYIAQIRTHALGNFGDLLAMTARHPAMLMYLDNSKNTAPNSPVGLNRKRGLNENYARELMELHTLGVDSGYTQEDIIALAKIFTGWGLNPPDDEEEDFFYFYEKRHDPEDKVFLGHKISASGIEEGEQALDILATHPATAKFISYKLAQYFVADRPPSSLVDKLAREFIASQGNIKTVLDTLIHSEEFNSSQYYKQKFTTPYQYVISLVRMAEIEQPSLLRVRGMLNQLSMPLYGCQVPTGYRNTQSAWLNPQAMLQRTGFAFAIANGVLNRDYTVKQQQLTQNLGELSSKTKQVIANSPPKLRSPLIMGSPEAMYR